MSNICNYNCTKNQVDEFEFNVDLISQEPDININVGFKTPKNMPVSFITDKEQNILFSCIEIEQLYEVDKFYHLNQPINTFKNLIDSNVIDNITDFLVEHYVKFQKVSLLDKCIVILNDDKLQIEFPLSNLEDIDSDESESFFKLENKVLNKKRTKISLIFNSFTNKRFNSLKKKKNISDKKEKLSPNIKNSSNNSIPKEVSKFNSDI